MPSDQGQPKSANGDQEPELKHPPWTPLNTRIPRLQETLVLQPYRRSWVTSWPNSRSCQRERVSSRLNWQYWQSLSGEGQTAILWMPFQRTLLAAVTHRLTRPFNHVNRRSLHGTARLQCLDQPFRTRWKLEFESGGSITLLWRDSRTKHWWNFKALKTRHPAAPSDRWPATEFNPQNVGSRYTGFA